ncbi:MAG TPA: LamG domain-containing protein [Sedimentisphaerales bacterium]|nr:LamG domain-containing protein [Sedimentisphaerales bacterium]
MCKKLICLVFSILVVGMASSGYADLVGRWTLDDGSGTTVSDSSGNGNDGTIVGNPTWIAGVGGTALEFHGLGAAGGGGDYIDCGNDASLDITGPISIALWIRPGADDPEGNGTETAPMAKAMSGMSPSWSYQVRYGWGSPEPYMAFTFNTSPRAWAYVNKNLERDEWCHIACSYDGTTLICYLDGEATESTPMGAITSSPTPVLIGSDGWGCDWIGAIDDVRIYNHALSESEILGTMAGQVWPYAYGPDPEDGALRTETWVTFSWKPGGLAVSHNIYMGDNFDDVNEATRDSDLFRINQDLDSTFYVAGLLGYPYPDGLVPGTTYYWRIDEVNEAEPNSPWKGDVWSFMVPPKTAYYPDPADGAELVPENPTLTWTAGFGAKMHTVYFGEDFDVVNEAVGGVAMGLVSYAPGPLKLAKTYYWRVDEFDGADTYKGDVWSFTTQGAVSGPNPADGAVDVKPTRILSWDAGAVAASHEVYFGADADAVKNATKTSPEYKGAKALGEESYDPGKLALTTTYYWRIDEVNDTNPDSPWAGNVWSFTTGDFFVIDDFEDYDAGDNQIWCAWHDGLGYGTPGTADYFAGNGTGAAVGDENTTSYTEETIVNGGLQSMPLVFDNNKQGYSKYSEVELTLSAVRDWSEQGVAELSLWFRGYPGSVGSFVEAPAGTYTMTASGADIWAVNGVEADEFHFAYKTLTGIGSIVARVQSIDNTNAWAKAGVMIRESLSPDSAHAFAAITPANGVAAQGRPSTGGTSFNTNQSGIAAPYWVKLERSVSGNFTVYHSANGTNWQQVTGATPQNIPMGSNVYVGLALTSTDAALTCQAVFSNVTITGTVGTQWAHQDIGIASNAAEPLYVAISNSAGTPAVVIHDDPAATQIDTWTEWVIPLQAFADQGINLTNVDRIAIGLGTKGNITVPGGSGKMYFDDIRLNRPKDAAE